MHLSRKSIRARRDFLLKLVIGAVGVGALIAFVTWFAFERDWVTTDNAFVTGNIIPVHSDATGVVAAVLAEETQMVKKGDVLVRLDGQRARAALSQAEAELGRAVRAVGALFASRRQICQKVLSRAAISDRTRHDLARYQAGGAERRGLAPVATEHRRPARRAGSGFARDARGISGRSRRASCGVTRINHPDIEAAKAKFNDAYVEFLRQNIRAPATGYVAKRQVQVGQRVRPGDPILNIVPLDHLWVEANLWENRMDRVRPGQEAIVKVDLYGSDQTYHGVVEGIVPGSGSVFAMLPPDNATGNFIRIVQRIPVRIALQADELEKQPLRPGLSTVISIDVSSGGVSVNASQTKTSSAEYTTHIYDDDLTRAKVKTEEIVKANLLSTSDEAEKGCAIGE